jgi:hypothetical protein
MRFKKTAFQLENEESHCKHDGGINYLVCLPVEVDIISTAVSFIGCQLHLPSGDPTFAVVSQYRKPHLPKASISNVAISVRSSLANVSTHLI